MISRAPIVLAAALGGVTLAVAPLVWAPSETPNAHADSPDGGTRTLDTKLLRKRTAAPTLPEVQIGRSPPDPTPLVEKGQWVYDLRWSRGEMYLVGTHRVELPGPQKTPRAMGRFALELFEGSVLVERVRFDFPLLGAADTVDAGNRFSFERKLTTRIGVMFPATSRGTRLELWDRATDTRWPLAWPPSDSKPAESAAP
jgi:hypothetical protein